MKRFMLLPVLLCCSILRAQADGFIVVNPIRPAPSWQPYAFAPLEITYHHVNVKIDGQIATTTVDQEFYNPNPQRLEGTYLFPVPKGAQIDKFSMEIGGRQVQAELLAADKARSIYEDIVRKLRDPALLEYEGRDVFKVRVFPIEPNSPKRIQLSYSQVLPSESGLISYVYPLNTEKFSAKPIKNVSVKVELDSPKALKTIYSPSHAVEIKRDGPHRATASYEASDARPDTDFALYFAPESDAVGVNLLTCKTAGEDGYFLLLASPGVDTKSTKAAPKDVAFVLDTSGSMSGKKIEQAKKALQFCVENLNASDRFEVIRFSTDVEPLFGKLAEASKENCQRAESFVQDLKAMGGTAIDDALRQVLASRPAKDDRPFMIVFLTDGEPTVGETDEDTIVAHVKKEGEGRTRVFCFGIGSDVNTHLLDKIAEETRAAAQYVLPEEDLEIKVSAFFSKITEPVLANPVLRVSGGAHVSKMYPDALPDLFKGGQLIVVGRYTGEGSAAVEIEGTVNGQSRKFAQDVKFSADSTEAEFIPRLWATRRVGYLLDEIRLHGENAELRDEVTQLARHYGIVTPYTAYLIIEDETRRNVPLTMQSMPQLNMDKDALSVTAQNWNAFQSRRGGEQALADARYGSALRFAASADVANATGAIEANRALGLPTTLAAPLASRGASYRGGQGGIPAMPPSPSGVPEAAKAPDSRERVAEYTQQNRFVNGRNFFLNQQQQWIDPEVQNMSSARRVRLQFNSAEYFALAAKEPQALPWLSLGRNVQFVLDGKVYDIYE
jgi:Ca-activated chloride channel family protein